MQTDWKTAERAYDRALISLDSTCPAGYPRVVDGDTLDFSGTRVRMFGIGEGLKT